MPPVRYLIIHVQVFSTTNLLISCFFAFFPGQEKVLRLSASSFPSRFSVFSSSYFLLPTDPCFFLRFLFFFLPFFLSSAFCTAVYPSFTRLYGCINMTQYVTVAIDPSVRQFAHAHLADSVM